MWPSIARSVSLRGLAGHHVVDLGVDAHRECRGGVGDQVDPQDLGGEQRQHDRLAACAAQPDDAREDDAEEDREDLAHVRRQQVAQELLDVVEDHPALTDGSDDRGEVVIAEDHPRRLLGDLGAGDAHGHADVGRLERRRVVDPVAGHRHDLPVGLERVDEPQLVLGRHAA